MALLRRCFPDRFCEHLADHRRVVVEDVLHRAVRPLRANALAVVHDVVKPRVARADLPREVDFGADALPDDVGAALEHGDFSRTLEVAPIGARVNAAVEDAPRKALLRRRQKRSAKLGAEGVAHDEQIPAVEHDVLAVREVEIVVGNQEVARIEQMIRRTDAALGEDAHDAGLAEDPEDLARSVGTRHARAPAVHAAREHAHLADREQAKSRASAVGRVKDEIVGENFYILIGKTRGKIARKRARAADDAERCGGNFLLCHLFAPFAEGFSGSTDKMKSARWMQIFRPIKETNRTHSRAMRRICRR